MLCLSHQVGREAVSIKYLSVINPCMGGMLASNRLKTSSMRLSVSSDAVSFPAGGIRLFQDVGTVGH